MIMDPMRKDAANDRLPLVAAVVLNWNGGSINRTCLDTLLASGYPNLKIFFVDNGSTDGSAEDIRERYPGIELLFLDKNYGFTGGNNQGIRRALDLGAEHLLILNNDVRVTKGFLEPLVEILRRRPGIVGPKILDPSGRIWCAGGMICFHQNLTRLRGFGRPDNSRFNKTESVDYMPACSLLISREVFETIGMLDEEYFCYLEDVAFCARAREAGFTVSYCPDSKVRHHFSHSTGGGYTPARKYMNGLNSVRFLRRHGTLKSWIAFWLFDVAALPPVLLVRLFQGKAKGVLAKGRGILDGLKGARVTPDVLERYRKRENGR